MIIVQYEADLHNVKPANAKRVLNNSQVAVYKLDSDAELLFNVLRGASYNYVLTDARFEKLIANAKHLQAVNAYRNSESVTQVLTTMLMARKDQWKLRDNG